MLIEDNRKSKSFSVRSIMRNRKMVRKFSAALDTPVGSTKRKQARDTLGSLLSLQDNRTYIEDGMGGNPLQAIGESPGAQNLIQSGVDLSKQMGQTVKDTGAVMGTMGLGATGAVESGLSNVRSGAEDLWRYGSAAASGDPVAPKKYSGTSFGDTTSADIMTNYWKDRFPDIQRKTIMGNGVPTGGTADDIMARINSKLDNTGSAIDEKLKATENAGDPAQMQEYYDKYKKTDGSQNGGSDGSSDGSDGSDGIDYGDELYKIGVPEQFWTIAKAGDENWGAEQTFQYIYNDIEELKKLYPNTPEEELKKLVGASMSGQIKDLYYLKREELGMDAQLSELNRLRDRNSNYEANLTEYIRYKDVYYNKINDMQEDLKSTYNAMDTSNPHTRARMDQYSDYLGILKGRQGRRYADHVSESITRADRELENHLSTYNANVDKFNLEYEFDKAETTESFTSKKQIITDLYNNIAGAEEEEIRKQMLRNELTLQETEILSDTMKALGTTYGLDVDLDEVQAADRVQYETLWGKDKEGNYPNGKEYDIYDVAYKAGMEGRNPAQAQYLYMDSIPKDVQTDSRSGQFGSSLSGYNLTLDGIAREAIKSGELLAGNSSSSLLAGGVVDGVVAGLKAGMKEYFRDDTSGDERKKMLKEIADDIMGRKDVPWYKGGAWRNDDAETNKEDFLDKYKTGEYDDMANAMWNFWEVKNNPELGSDKFFDNYNREMPATEASDLFTQHYSNYNKIALERSTYQTYLDELEAQQQ